MEDFTQHVVVMIMIAAVAVSARLLMSKGHLGMALATL